MRPGAEGEVDRLKLHPYAGVAVASSTSRRWWLAAFGVVLVVLIATLFLVSRVSSTVSAPPAPPAAAAGAPREDRLAPAATPGLPAVVDLVESWALAWTQQRVEDYLSYYATDFRPPGSMSREEWSAQRRARISRPRRIEVRITDLEAELLGPRSCRVGFQQSYVSDSFRDTTRKTLDLVLDDGRWRIVAERSEQ